MQAFDLTSSLQNRLLLRTFWGAAICECDTYGETGAVGWRRFFSRGVAGLTLADRDGGIKFWATPHYCLRRLGCIGDGATKGGGNYEAFR